MWVRQPRVKEPLLSKKTADVAVLPQYCRTRFFLAKMVAYQNLTRIEQRVNQPIFVSTKLSNRIKRRQIQHIITLVAVFIGQSNTQASENLLHFMVGKKLLLTHIKPEVLTKKRSELLFTRTSPTSSWHRQYPQYIVGLRHTASGLHKQSQFSDKGSELSIKTDIAISSISTHRTTRIHD